MTDLEMEIGMVRGRDSKKKPPKEMVKLKVKLRAKGFQKTKAKGRAKEMDLKIR